MHTKSSASELLPASVERFGYREALAEVIIELGQATVGTTRGPRAPSRIGRKRSRHEPAEPSLRRRRRRHKR